MFFEEQVKKYRNLSAILRRMLYLDKNFFMGLFEWSHLLSIFAIKASDPRPFTPPPPPPRKIGAFASKSITYDLGAYTSENMPLAQRDKISIIYFHEY
jgi:hypothetical protein